ncbi:MAG: hypothetical protein ABFD66_03310, partial [Smithella sp.]
MRPDISEFSYGYALTEELIHWHGTELTAAPFFPSLYQEGQEGGGYDLMLERPGMLLFLQFKLSDCMVRNTAREVKDGIFSAPCYRMHIRPARHSQQHEMLLKLENDGNEVYYCHHDGGSGLAFTYSRPSVLRLPDCAAHCRVVQTAMTGDFSKGIL